MSDDGSVDRVLIFDTTLRDGEQSPGCTLTCAEKLEVARQLVRLRVDIIEAGFPAASPGDWDAVHAIASEVGGCGGLSELRDAPIICGLARATPNDVESCARAIAPADRRRIHTFLATSDLHLEHKLRMTRRQALETATEMVALARSLCDDVEFSPEDASRSDPAFLHEVLIAAVEAGATTLNIPDTVGYAVPDEYYALLLGIRSAIAPLRGSDRIVLSAHCHDDLGLAVANSLAGIRAGARQVECTVNGIGERAGNAALEEIVMALHTRRSFYSVSTGIDTRQIARTSRLVAQRTGSRVSPNKAIVGANAFAHEAGIHQDGVIKHRLTYEIMIPEAVGVDGNSLVLGKHSGRHAVRLRLRQLGHTLSDAEMGRVFARFKDVADRKKHVDDRDLDAIVAGELGRPAQLFELVLLQVACGTHSTPSATVGLRDTTGATRLASAQGDGPVDAVCRAVNAVVGDTARLVEFSVDAVTEGIDALGGVTIRLRPLDTSDSAAELDHPDDHSGTGYPRPRTFAGFGAHTDIIVATAEAYVGAINALLRATAAQPETVQVAS
jgi:2-isopropylmalate synthase